MVCFVHGMLVAKLCIEEKGSDTENKLPDTKLLYMSGTECSQLNLDRQIRLIQKVISIKQVEVNAWKKITELKVRGEKECTS